MKYSQKELLRIKNTRAIRAGSSPFIAVIRVIPGQFRSLRWLVQATIVLIVGSNVFAQETNSTSRLDFPAFRIIAERNIFNPNRSGRSPRNYEKSRQERRVRTEAFALRGTMSYEKGRFAFFEGTSLDYRKALETADTIAGFKIAAVGPDSVKLESNGKQVELQVGMQMKKPEGGDWELASGTDSVDMTAAAPASADPNATPGSQKTEVSSPGGASDILKRLMQKREQDLGNEVPRPEQKTEGVQNEK
jgi:hypothetical protein